MERHITVIALSVTAILFATRAQISGDSYVRLIGGNISMVPHSGRLEVQYQNQWGTVCDRDFTNREATVVCRQLGATNVTGIAISSAYYGQGRGRILLDNVECIGNETMLSACSHSVWGQTDCSHSRDVSVICLTGPVQAGDIQLRLVHGLPAYQGYEGRLELAYKGIWGTVCRSGVSSKDATAICHMMNMMGRAQRVNTNLPGQGPIWLDTPDCPSNESHLLDCLSKPFGVISTACSHNTDVILQCSMDRRIDVGIRLKQGNTLYNGRVELSIGSVWGTICDNHWTKAEATVACRQLGISSDEVVPIRASYYGSSPADMPVHVESVRCRGTEQTLAACNHQLFGSVSSTCQDHENNAGVICYPAGFIEANIRVRLADGYSDHSGRVEIFHKNEWGTICANYWSSTDARVVCGMLGFNMSGSQAFRNNGLFPVGSGRIWLDRVACQGTERHIALCPSSGWARTDHCSHDNDASVICQGESALSPARVRLVNGTSQQGRVEVSLNGGHSWGTVCHNMWTNANAKVICRMLGLETDMALANGGAYFGQGTVGIMYTFVRCSGNERSIDDCRKTYANSGMRSACSHDRDAGVICQNAAMLNSSVRLVNGRNRNEGRVEVYMNRQWSAICGNNWSYKEARVVCRQASLQTFLSTNHARVYAIAIKRTEFGRGPLFSRISNFRCKGTEASLSYCSYNLRRSTSCGTLGTVGVMCLSANPSVTSVRLTGGRTANEGRVEAQVLGKWGTICSRGFGNTDAAVVCRQLGYTGGQRVSRSLSVRGPIWFQGLSCRGREQNISQCGHQTWGRHTCTGHNSAVVRCTGNPGWNRTIPLRLVNGPSPMEGRVEILYHGQWSAVCDDFWDDSNAAVVCRQLGYPTEGALARLRATYGRGTGTIFVNDVHCTGLETNIGQCIMDIDMQGHLNCHHAEDAGVRCLSSTEPHMPVQVFLVGGTSSSQGTVQLFYNNTWGTICDDYWSVEDAQVICRMLNLPPEGALAHTFSLFGQGNGTIFFDDVQCIGNETSIMQCPHRGLNQHNCNHWEDAGVVCRYNKRIMESETGGEPSQQSRNVVSDVRNTAVIVPSEIRLVGGSYPYQGRVEVYHNGQWGSVCDDVTSPSLATVICRHAGFASSMPLLYGTSYYGNGAPGSPIWLDNVLCSGSEALLDECAHAGWGVNDCQHDEDLSVSCVPDGMVETTVRLVGGQGAHEGRVELQINGTWGSICDDMFDNTEAGVICNMLGYPRADSYARLSATQLFGRGSGPIYLDNLRCRGTETSILQCPASPLNYNDCSHYEDAGVHCLESGIVQARLRGGSNDSEGRVEISVNNTWGTICRDRLNQVSTARVLCRMLGKSYGNGVRVVPTQLYGSGSGPIFMSSLICTGFERNIVQCSHVGILNNNCRHYQDMAIRCLQDIPLTTSRPQIITPAPTPDPASIFVRLAGGGAPNRGRVEVFYENAFGTVCDDNWDNQDAQVVCSMLGYQRTGSQTASEGTYGPGSGRIWVDEMNCRGNESSIAQCPTSNGWTAHDCFHEEDATVICSTNAVLNNFLLMTDSDHRHVYRMDLSTFSYTEIPHANHDNPIAVGYDHVEQKLYWSDVASNIIKKSNLDGSNSAQLLHLPNDASPDGLAVDPISRNLYFTDTGTNTITLVRLDGGAYKTLISSGLQEPRGITVHPGKGYIFWTDWSSTDPKIERANMDGSSRTAIIRNNNKWPESIRWPNSVAIDYQANLLYWTDGYQDTIQKSDFSGKNRVVLIRETGQLYGLAVMQDYIYFTDWAESTVMRINKSGGDRTTVGPSVFGQLTGLIAYKTGDGIELLNASNGCTNARGHCSHICVPMPGNTIKCLCPGDMVLGVDGITCGPNSPCASLTAPRHGSISPPGCISGRSSIGTTCTVTCDQGYQALGTTSLHCLANEQWSHTVTALICTDITAPSLTCPPDMTVEASREQQTAVVQYPVIVPTDNSQQPLTIEINPPTGSRFTEGRSVVTVKVTDANHLSSSCSFAVTVTVVRCGQPTNLPSNLRVIVASCHDYLGAGCGVMCDRGYQQQGPPSITCGKVNNQTQWLLSGVACQATPCPALTPPANGAFTPANCSTGQSFVNSRCTASCKEGYFLSSPQNVICQSTGEWSNRVSEVSCKDITPPVLTCPTAIITQIADRPMTSADVDWMRHVSVSDNSGLAVRFINPSNPLTLSEGRHTIHITAVDQANLPSSCTITVQITVLTCGRPSLGEHIQTVHPSCQDHYGATCDIGCRSGYTLDSTTSQITCDKAAPTDSHVQWLPTSLSCKQVDKATADPQHSDSDSSSSNTSTLILAVFLGLIIVCLIAVISFFAYKRLVFMKRGSNGVYELSPPDKGYGLDNPSYSQENF